MPILTDAAIRRCKPAAARRRIRDAGARSLFLIVEPSGFKAFEMRFRRPGGRIAKMRLGPYDLSGREVEGAPQVGQPLTLAAARALAAAVLRERAMGGDPIGAHKARRRGARAAAAERGDTYAAAARDYVDEHTRKKNRNWAAAARLLGLDYPPDGGEPVVVRGGLAERWRDRPVREIDGHAIWQVVDEARRVGSPGLGVRNSGCSDARARLLFGALSGLFAWLGRQRRVDVNPCRGVARPASGPPRDRVLTGDEVKLVWRAAGEVGEPQGAIIKLLLLTGARLNEAAGMRRAELSEDGTVWALPGSRTKNARPHTVPLPPLAREIIAGAAPVEGEYIFSINGRTPVGGWSRIKDRLDAAMGADVAPWRIHDLRRTAVTHMAELGIRPDVIELTVNHASGSRGGVAGVYNRSELMPERRAALERWAAHVQGIVSGATANVVLLRAAGAAA